ncbi:MAG: ROK family protein [Actinomycetota bacterium]
MSGPLALGIDVGGTKVALGLVGADGTLAAFERVEHGDVARVELLAWVAARAAAFAATAGAVAAVGVVVPEVVDPSGELRSATTVAWRRAEVVAALEGIAPVALGNDVEAAAYAEARFGAGRGHRSVGFVTVGTGISSSLVLDGEPWAGAHGAAQLLGSAPLSIGCPRCGERVRVCLEEVAAGPALVARSGGAAPSAEELFALAAAGDADAAAHLEATAEVLGSFLALFVNIVDPEILVLGGGIGTAGGAFLDAVVVSTRAHVWAEHVRGIDIVPAVLGPRAQVVGAGVRALRSMAA